MSFLNNHGGWCSDLSVEDGIQKLLQSQNVVSVLDLSDLEISRLPKSLLQLSGLQEIYLDRNNLAELPDWIGEFKDLRVLSLGRNQITALPESLLGLSHCLLKIFLGHNQITELPFPEWEFAVLKHGSIGRNPIQGMISRRWMMWDDFVQFPRTIEVLVPPNLPDEFGELFSKQAAGIIIDCQEPMVYEMLLQGVRKVGDEILWTKYFLRPWMLWVGEQIIQHIPRGAVVDDSLREFIF